MCLDQFQKYELERIFTLNKRRTVEFSILENKRGTIETSTFEKLGHSFLIIFRYFV